MRQRLDRVTIGADPEFFLKKRGTSQYVSAHGIVPGTKEHPHKLKGGAVQLDGTAVEFNIDPASTKKEFSENIKTVLAEIRKIVPDKYDFEFKPAVKFAPRYFEKRVPESAKELGCNPDFDAYRFGAPNNPPDNKTTMRTGAGHIHIGFCKNADVKDRDHIIDCSLLAKRLDRVFRPIEKNWDKDTLRRSMYGKLGCFRPKPYGMEYRSLSNAWLNYPKLWPFLFEVCVATVANVHHGAAPQPDITETISPYIWNTLISPTCYLPHLTL